MELRQPALTLANAQDRIRADHARIRALLDELEPLAVALEANTGQAAPQRLTDGIWRLFLTFDDHLAEEEGALAPLLVEAGVWGRVQVERMNEEHRQQRSMLLAMVDECDGRRRAPKEIAQDTRWLVDALRTDMNHEERQLDVARDDGFVVDQLTG